MRVGQTLAAQTEQGGKATALEAPLYSLSSYRCLSAATTLGSASVVVSPSVRPSATSRSSRRMILPLRVLGSSAAKEEGGDRKSVV